MQHEYILNGAFEIESKLSIDSLIGSAASICINGNNNFGFCGGRGLDSFYEGPLMNRQGAYAKFTVQENEIFKLSIKRKANKLAFYINDHMIGFSRHTQDEIKITIRPMRSIMTFYSFILEGRERVGDEPISFQGGPNNLESFDNTIITKECEKFKKLDLVDEQIHYLKAIDNIYKKKYKTVVIGGNGNELG